MFLLSRSATSSITSIAVVGQGDTNVGSVWDEPVKGCKTLLHVQDYNCIQNCKKWWNPCIRIKHSDIDLSKRLRDFNSSWAKWQVRYLNTPNAKKLQLHNYILLLHTGEHNRPSSLSWRVKSSLYYFATTKQKVQRGLFKYKIATALQV